MAEVLSPEQLNRATLARQLLLERAELDPVAAIERLGGLQAQEPKPPNLALWTRLADFAREPLAAALADRSVVRATAMRATLHLLSAPDYLRLRGSLQPMLDGAMESILRQRGAVDVAAVVAAARAILADGPLTFGALRPRLAERFPDADERALGYAVRMQVPLVLVPGGERWGFPADPAFTPAEAWLGTAPGPPDAAALVRRHLGAFGPASTADVQTWSGLGGLQPVLDGMADELVAFRAGRRTLYDLPDAPRPDPATPAPPRFLPEFDSLLLAHKDRTRVIADEHRRAITTKNLRIRAVFLVDGVAAGTWAIATGRGAAKLTVSPFGSLAKPVREALAEEGAALLAFLEPEAKPAVAFARPG